MANYYKTNVSVSSRQAILTAIENFITAGGPGPQWTVGGYIPAGELFVENTNTVVGTNVYPYFIAPASPSKMILAGLTTCDGASSGFNAGAGPLSTVLNITPDDTFGLGLHFDDAPGYMTGDRGVLHMFGSEDHFIVCLRYGQPTMYQTLYVGLYTPHCTGGIDTCPQIVVGNTPGTFYLMDEATYGPNMQPEPKVEEWMHAFPLGMLKTDVAGDRRYIRHQLSRYNPKDAFSEIPSRRNRIARNDRDAPIELFAYEQYLSLTENMRGESLTLDSVYRITDDSDIEEIITIGANDYFIWPSALQPDANPRCMAIGPMGTVVP